MQVQGSHIQQPLEQTDAQANHGDDHEHQQERSANDGRTNGSSPGHSAGENFTNIANQSGDSHSLSRSNAYFQ